MLVVVVDELLVVGCCNLPPLQLKLDVDVKLAEAKSNFSALTLTVNVDVKSAFTLPTLASQLKVNVDAGRSSASLT